eukprot:5361969-Pleurochrysis_carterae.AAC.1
MRVVTNSATRAWEVPARVARRVLRSERSALNVDRVASQHRPRCLLNVDLDGSSGAAAAASGPIASSSACAHSGSRRAAAARASAFKSPPAPCPRLPYDSLSL